jgi:hypothetical protein
LKYFIYFLVLFLDEDLSQESTPKNISTEQQESVPADTTLEKPNDTRTESDTGKEIDY